jgi:AraC-like DNA-binding protein
VGGRAEVHAFVTGRTRAGAATPNGDTLGPVAQRSPTLGVRALRPLIAGLQVLGHDPAALLRAVGLDRSSLRDPDARVPSALVGRFWSAALTASGDQDLALHLAEAADVSEFDVHAYAFLSSPTLGAAFERMAAYQRLLNDTNRIVVERGRREVVVRHQRQGGLPVGRQPAEFIMAVSLRLARLAVGDSISPKEVRFAHAAPASTAAHARTFRAPVRFNAGENALVMAAALVERSCLRADPGLAALLDRYAGDRLERIAPRSSFADRAREAVAATLREGEPSAAKVALRLRMSVRSLSRTLAAEGTSYRALLEQMRRELAGRYLADPEVSIAEVAFLLGFKEVSAFYHAFRSWTGRTPREFRRERAVP